LLNEVLAVYGKYSSFKLEEFTHAEKPWKKARTGLRISEPSVIIINKKLMGKFYRGRIEEPRED
jgi:uncharacterized phage-associated protein